MVSWQLCLELVQEDGFTTTDAAPSARLEPGGKKRGDDAVGGPSGDRLPGIVYGGKKHEGCAMVLPERPLRDLTLDLGDDRLRLCEPVHRTRRLEHALSLN